MYLFNADFESVKIWTLAVLLYFDITENVTPGLIFFFMVLASMHPHFHISKCENGRTQANGHRTKKLSPGFTFFVMSK